MGEVDQYKLIAERLEFRLEQMIQKTQQVVEHKLEMQAI